MMRKGGRQWEKKGESETWLWEIETDMWQGGTDLSLDELVASPRSVCQGLALSRCQAWVASWQAFECVCHVRLGWNRSWTHAHVMTLTRCHQSRHTSPDSPWQTQPLSRCSSSTGFSQPLSPPVACSSSQSPSLIGCVQPQPLTSNLGLNDYI